MENKSSIDDEIKRLEQDQPVEVKIPKKRGRKPKIIEKK